jgi:hypothetical protein
MDEVHKSFVGLINDWLMLPVASVAVRVTKFAPNGKVAAAVVFHREMYEVLCFHNQ